MEQCGVVGDSVRVVTVFGSRRSREKLDHDTIQLVQLELLIFAVVLNY